MDTESESLHAFIQYSLSENLQEAGLQVVLVVAKGKKEDPPTFV